MITFRDTGAPATEITGAVFVIAGGLTLDADTTGLPRITLTAGGVGGSGTPGRLSKWTGASTLGDSLFSDDGSHTTLTTGDLIFSSAVSRIRPGATSFSLRDTANSADNLLVADSGAITLRSTVVGATTISVTTAFIVGTNPAAAGAVRLPNNSSITSRLADNSADSILVGYTSANNIQFGSTRNQAAMQYFSGTTAAHIFYHNDASTVAWYISTSTAGGRVALGGTSNVNVGIYVRPENVIVGSTTAYGILADATFGTAVTVSGKALTARLNTDAAAFTMANGVGLHVLDAIKGAGSTITNLYGLYIDSQTQGGTNYALYTNSGTVRIGDVARIQGAGTEAAPSLLRIEGANATTAGDAWIYFGQIVGGSDLLVGLAGTDSRTDSRTANDAFVDAGQSLQLRARINGSTYSNYIRIGQTSSGGITFYTGAQSAAATLRFTIRQDGDLQLSTLGIIDNTTSPTPDFSLVYDGSVSKWKPRLITASIASSGVVSSGVLPDGTAAMLVNTITAALSGTPASPSSISIQSGYKSFIITMAGAIANQVYLLEYATLPTIVTGTATGTQTSTTLQDTSKSWTVNQFAGYYVYLTGGTGSGQWRSVVSNTSNTLTVSSAWGTTPVAASTTYEISGFRVAHLGTATSGGSNLLNDTGKSWEVNSLAAYTVLVRSGTGAGQFRTVVSNTSTQLLVSPPWVTNPDNTSVYVVSPLVSTSDKIVHGNLDDTKSYYYRYRILGATASSYYPAVPSANTVSTSSQVVAFGLVLASQIAVGNLSAIAASASNMAVGSFAATTGLFRQLQTSSTTSFGANTAARLWIDGPTLQVRGDTSTSDAVRIILGSFSYAAGALTPVSDSTWSNNAPSISIAANTNGSFVSASEQPNNAITPGTAAYNGIYTVSGNMRVNCTITPATIVGFTGLEARVELEYNINSGAWSTPIVVMSVSEPTTLNSNVNYPWTYDLPVPSLTAGQTLNIRLTYKGSLSCSKVVSGSMTISGDSGVAGISIAYSTATANTRRGLYVSGLNSQPQLSLQPIATAPTSGNTQNGEIWFNDANDSIEFNSNGTVIVLNDATASRNGLVRLAECLGGTAAAPTVVALKGSGATPITINTTAPAFGYSLIATSTTVATWQPVTPVHAASMRRVSFWARSRASNNQMVGDGCYDPTNGTLGGSSSVTASSDDNHNYILLTGANGVGNYARVTSAGSGGSAIFDELQANQDPIFMCLIRTGSTFANLRFYAGLTDGHQTGAAATGNYIGFRSSASTLIGVLCKAGTESVTGTVQTMSTSTVYLLKVRCSGGTAYFSVNNGAETSLSTNYPNTANTPLGWQVAAIDTASDAQDVVMSLGYIYVEYGK